MAERQTCVKLKQFTLDRGGEFVNKLLGNELRERGIVLHLTAAHSPEENGVSERGNRTISTKARLMMLESGMPLWFWVQACNTAVFLTNRTITSALSGNRTPFEAWHFRKPSINHVRVFGCLFYALIRKEVRGSKFGPVSSQGVLMGFDEDNFNYHIYDLSSHTIITTHHATFNENSFPFKDQKSSNSSLTQSSPNSGVNIQFFDDESEDEHLEDARDEQLPTVPPEIEDSSIPEHDQSVNGEVTGTDLPRRSDRIRQPVVRYTSSAVCDNVSP